MQQLPKAGARLRSLAARKGARGALAVGASLAAGALTLGAFALPAGATLTAPANTTMVGSGSSTTFFMMQAMDSLFNSSPGCQEFVPFPSSTTPQPLDYSCVGPQQTLTSGVANAIPENPLNDVSVQEQPLGSSNGIAQLEDQGAHGAGATSGGVSINVANNQSYARSSRALSSGDLKGLNFVAYAQDGVPWFHYHESGGALTPSEAIKTLTQLQLQQIYNGTLTNWDQVKVGSTVGKNAPIVVFSAQEGSGTQSTFKTFLGFDPSASANQVNCYTPSGGSKQCVGPAVIFENEDAQIQPNAFTSTQTGFVTNNPIWGTSKTATAKQIKADAIFFFSAGKYAVQCKVSTKDCGGSPLPTGYTNTLGEVNGIAATEATILENTFPVDRYLYNVYSNGSNSNLVTANPATINYVSEVGFICNPNKGKSAAAVDMLTGNTYISEIQSVITSSGFYPLSAGGSTGKFNQTEIDEGSVPHPGSGLIGPAPYSTYDTFAKAANGDPMGFCLTTDTDSNSNS